MKKSILYFLTAIMLFAVSCSESYDDSALVGRVDNLENRVAKLEELCKQMNTNISSLQSLVTALQNNDYVTGVTPITKNGETIGYTITFTKSQPITIYHGEDGKDGQNGTDGKDGVNGTDGQDGHTPIIGVKQDTDGIYYWTLDGDWLLDDAGNKIKAQGTDGKDGQNGIDGTDGTTPQLKIENDYWYISYDNGKTWTQLGKAMGEDGQDGVDKENNDSFFQGVDTSNDDYVIFTLADGTELVLPRHKNLSISFDIANGAACMPSASIKVGYKLTGADSGTTIETIGDGGWKSVVTKTDISSGYITVTAPESGGDGKVVMLATTSNGFAAMKAITFEEGVVDDICDVYHIGYAHSTLKVTLNTNLTYAVNIPKNAEKWISVADTRAAKRTETLVFTILENPVYNPARSATIELIGECGDVLQSFIIMQKNQPSEDSIVFADAIVKQICVEKFDTNGDGELSEKEASAVTAIGGQFFGEYRELVSSFNELHYFVNLTYLGVSAFWGCSNLESISIPESVTEMDDSFDFCSNLKSVYITNMDAWYNMKFRSVGPLLFGANLYLNNKLVTNIAFPNGTTVIDARFRGCASLVNVVLPEGTVKIGDSAFTKCKNLRQIIIPNSIVGIGASALQLCTNLTQVTIPENVATIGSAAFQSCSNLTKIYCKANTPPALGDGVFKYGANALEIYVPSASVELYKTADGWKDYADKIVGYTFNN